MIDVAALLAPQRWDGRQACLGLDPDLFFPGRGEMKELAAAKAVCNAGAKGGLPCPVRAECLQYSIDAHIIHGVFGGKSERERRNMRRDRDRNEPIAHGTAGGYQAHRRRNDPACPACLQAHADAKRARRKQPVDVPLVVNYPTLKGRQKWETAQ